MSSSYLFLINRNTVGLPVNTFVLVPNILCYKVFYFWSIRLTHNLPMAKNDHILNRSAGQSNTWKEHLERALGKVTWKERVEFACTKCLQQKFRETRNYDKIFFSWKSVVSLSLCFVHKFDKNCFIKLPLKSRNRFSMWNSLFFALENLKFSLFWWREDYVIL